MAGEEGHEGVKISKAKFIRDLAVGDVVQDVFAVKYKKPPREYARGYVFEMRLSDVTGEITAKYWGDRNLALVRKLYDSFSADDVVYLTGTVKEFMDRPEIALSKENRDMVVRRSDYDIHDFIRASGKETGKMMPELLGIIGSVGNPHLKALLESLFVTDAAFVEKFRNSPGSMARHQNCIGGLLEHTLNVAKICGFICDIHPKLDRDLAVSGAILHDIGKTREYRMSTSIDISEEGMLLGHIVIGSDLVRGKIDAIPGFPADLKLKVLHMVLGHHGALEHGSPKKPQFPEAIAVFFADDTDAKLDYYIRLKEEARTEDPWIYNKELGHIYLR